MGISTSCNALLILASLAGADRHGYAIRKDVTARSGGLVRLGSTTLYRLLGQLLGEGLIAEARSRPAAHLDDERRTYFHLTRAGRRGLSAEARRLERILLAVKPALGSRTR